MEKIDAIILAGGEGKRLRGLIKEIPKPLAMVDGKPFLDILLAQLNKCNCINHLILAVGYKAERIVEKYKDCSAYNFDIGFSIEEKLLGTGGGMKKAIGYTETKNILAMNGDSYTEVDMEDLIKTHRRNNSKLTIVLLKVKDAGRYGTVRINSHSRVTCFQEKRGVNEAGLINAGIYIFQRDIFDDVEENEVISIEEQLLPDFVENVTGGIDAYVVDGKFIDIGVPEAYQAAHNYLTDKKD